ncbi:hypothetical protein Btru_046478 [Bulinus truncatus]|nr:hypothetical protein Btru_046478 [Bulinus truncatus]
MWNDATSAGGCENVGRQDARHLSREGHLMRSIVRNMVANMEGVLSDLQGIMGDIQSLVVQIDHVTEKIDKRCSNEQQDVPGHRVHKPRCVHSSEMTVADGHNEPQSTALLSESTGFHQLNAQLEHLIQGRNAVCTRDNTPMCCRNKTHCNPRPKSSDVQRIFERSDLKEKLAFSSSRSLHNFSKDNGGIISSPSGGIAVVHPTIYKHNDSKCVVIKEEETDKLKSQHFDICTPVPPSSGSHSIVQCLPILAHNIPKLDPVTRQHQRYNEIRQRPENTNNINGGDGRRTSRIKHSVTSVYNKSFQAVTPTEQLSPALRPKNINNDKKHYAKNISGKEVRAQSTSAAISQEIQDRLGRSLPTSPRLTRSFSHVPHSSSPSSPQMQRSSTKAIYSKIDGSTPSTFDRSHGSVRIHQPSPHHYYHSIESDLDSEAINEGPDTRSMTPDIDWSYLNLMGNDRNLELPSGKWKTPDPNNDGYEVPVTSKTQVDPRAFQMLQTSPDVVAQLPLFQFRDSNTEIKGSSSKRSDERNSFDLTFKSSLMKHVFCSDISNGEVDFYCGWYESLVDSVLENISGYETFEEACEDFDHDVIVDESYVSFDDQFEEDDWDMGLRPEDNEDFDNAFAFLNAQHVYNFSLLACHNDINKNTTFLSSNINSADYAQSGSSPFYFCLEEKLDKKIKDSPYKYNRCSAPEEDLYDDMEFPSTPGCSFTDEDCCAIKPQLPDSHSNFILWPKTSVAETADLGKEHSHSSELTESQMTSSDDASCQAVGSGSPMSFSSPEAAFTSPDTDRCVTSSEGDDLLTSQEESYFQNSSHSFSPRSGEPVTNCPSANIRPREFLQSLYIFCQQRDVELTQDQDKSKLKEYNPGFETADHKVDNSKDNLSDTGSYTEDLSSYNRNVNTWTTYAMVHMQSDDVSDCASDILNDNNVTSSMTSSYIDADNIGAANGQQTVHTIIRYKMLMCFRTILFDSSLSITSSIIKWIRHIMSHVDLDTLCLMWI